MRARQAQYLCGRSYETNNAGKAVTAKTRFMSDKKKLLFVCIENANRSQMAEAFARMYGEDRVIAYSAGSRPGGTVNAKAIESMKELGYDLRKHHPKSLEEVRAYAPFDVVVTMGCGDACPWMPAKQFVDWQVPDPKNMNPEEFRDVRNMVGDKVKELIMACALDRVPKRL
jgi:arsenate reductase (thioredoxin)